MTIENKNYVDLAKKFIDEHNNNSNWSPKIAFLGLLVNVHGRKDEIQGARYIDTDRQRKVVAEEMACLGIVVC